MIPENIRIVGAHLSGRGKILMLFLIGLSHIIIAPVIVAIEESVNSGVLMFFSSLIIIHGDDWWGDRIVAVVNRVE